MSDELMNVSLNALRTLQTVYRTGAISAAADALEVQQPSVSYTIDRLRGALDDPLFLRHGRGIAPTNRCREMMPIVDRILVDAARLRDEEFDPAKSEAVVTIVTAGTASGTLIPRILRRVNEDAPKMTLALDMGHHDLSESLLEKNVDLVLSAAQPQRTGIRTTFDIVTDIGVCVMDANHPLAGKELTTKDIEQGRFVVPVISPGLVPPFVAQAALVGVSMNVVATIADVNAVNAVIRGTDLLSGSPSRLAATHAPKIAMARFPFDVDSTLHMHWAATADRSPLNNWLRKVVLEEAAALGPPAIG